MFEFLEVDDTTREILRSEKIERERLRTRIEQAAKNGAVKFRMKSTGRVIESGVFNALATIARGDAVLID